MRIIGPSGTSGVTNTRETRRSASQSFSLDTPDASQAARTATAPTMIGGIDALLALQGVEEPTERRRRAVKRGRLALDALDELKLGLLAGTLDTAALVRLRSAVADLKDGSGDSGLDAVLAEISLRVEVEVAKFGSPPDRGEGTK
jgi:class II flagellar assembly regulator FliX